MAHMSAGTTDTTACCLVGFAAAEPNSCQSPILSKAWTLDALYACQTPPRYTPLAMSLLQYWIEYECKSCIHTQSSTSGWTIVK